MKHFIEIFTVTLKQYIYVPLVEKKIAMFKREALENLKKWAAKSKHKPLVLRGARQVGKTTLVNEFAKQFDTYLMQK